MSKVAVTTGNAFSGTSAENIEVLEPLLTEIGCEKAGRVVLILDNPSIITVDGHNQGPIDFYENDGDYYVRSIKIGTTGILFTLDIKAI